MGLDTPLLWVCLWMLPTGCCTVDLSSAWQVAGSIGPGLHGLLYFGSARGLLCAIISAAAVPQPGAVMDGELCFV